ncbi:MAG: DUF898 family protein [Desulfobacteraceae bacterium]|nr:MAG: DUF898 family protein [Desulfobacteraceae bacterium]
MPEGNCDFSGRGRDYFLTVIIHLVLLTALTAGIYGPWAMVRIFKLKASHTRVRGRTVRFTGKGKDLLVSSLLWGLLIVVTIGIYTPWAACSFLRWKAANTWVEERPSEFTGSGVDLFFLGLVHLLLFPLLTLGLYLFWGLYRIYAWKEEHTRYGGERTSFGAGVKDFIKVSLLSGVLNVLTLNIFSPWALCMLYRWQIRGLMVGQGEGMVHFPPVKTPRVLLLLPPAIGFLFAWWLSTTLTHYLETGKELFQGQLIKGSAPGGSGGKDAQRVRITMSGKQSEEQKTPAAAKDMGQGRRTLGIFAPPRPRDEEESKGASLELRLGRIESFLLKNPASPDGFYSRGWVHQMKGDLDKALSDYNQALRLNPVFVDAFFNRGVIYVQTGKYELAVEDFSSALKHEKGSADAFSNRGSVYFQQGKFELAIQDYTSALKIVSDDPDILYNRGNAYVENGEIQKGKVDLIRAEALGQKSASEPLKRLP